jgi:hypothetical protein
MQRSKNSLAAVADVLWRLVRRNVRHYGEVEFVWILAGLTFTSTAVEGYVQM